MPVQPLLTPKQVQQVRSQVGRTNPRNRAPRTNRRRPNQRPAGPIPSLLNAGGSRSAQVVSAPAAQTVILRTPQPRIKQRTATSMIVSHRELMFPVSGQQAFTVTNTIINPGNSTMFPWLASLAVSWEQYRWKRLSFQYVSRCATSLAGSVMMAVDYDTVDGVILPATESALSANQTFQDGPAWVAMMAIQCDPKALMEPGPRKYVKISANGATPNRLSDTGQFYFATDSFASNNTACGKLYVDYEVEFFIPQLAVAPGGNTTQSVATSTGTGQATLFANSVYGGVLGITGAANTITIPVPGTYVFVLQLIGTGITALANSGGTATAAGLNGSAAIVNSGDTGALYNLLVTSTAINQTVVYTCSASSVTSTFLYISATTTVDA